MVLRPPRIMKRSGRCGFQPYSKRQDTASTEVVHVKKQRSAPAAHRRAGVDRPATGV